MNKVFIQGTKIDLRPNIEEDLNGPYWTWFNDAEVTRYMVKGAMPNTPLLQKHYFDHVIQDETNLILAIVLKESGQHIGNIGLHHLHSIHRTSEMGVIIGEKEYWGHGIATEAISLICRHGFDQLNLHRIELGVFADHISAINCYKKIGFKQEGLKREHIFKNGTYQDIVIMGMLQHEFNQTLF